MTNRRITTAAQGRRVQGSAPQSRHTNSVCHETLGPVALYRDEVAYALNRDRSTHAVSPLELERSKTQPNRMKRTLTHAIHPMGRPIKKQVSRIQTMSSPNDIHIASERPNPSVPFSLLGAREFSNGLQPSARRKTNRTIPRKYEAFQQQHQRDEVTAHHT